MALHAVIKSACREYFGTVKNHKLVGNRCDKCPLRTPCMKFGAAPARTFEELNESRATFEHEALTITEVSL